MKEQMLNLSIYSAEILGYLELNNFLRIDDGTDKHIMHWHKGNTVIEFNCNEISVLATQELEEPYLQYYLHGFSPNDSVLFAFLMHSWQIITLQHGHKMVTRSALSKTFEKVNYN